MTDLERDSELLARLGYLVLRRIEDREFQRMGEPPLWFVRMDVDAARRPEPIDVIEMFPFLDSFLPTAANYWGSRGSGRIRSGQWISHYPSGEEVPLEASAICRGNDDLLLIEFNKSVYERDKGYLQKARDNALEMERSAVLERTLKAQRRRTLALFAAFAGRVLRVDKSGRVVGGTPRDASVSQPQELGAFVPESAVSAFVSAISEAIRTGTTQSMEAGWMIFPIDHDECWAIERGSGGSS